MDPRLQQAAKSGSIDELYVLIEKNPSILDAFDAKSFVNTPLHVAAAFGNLEFAMELMNLKPSFARKLNTSGDSPLHLAINNGRMKFASWMLWIYPDFASIKGKNGITPFLLLVLKGDAFRVVECLRFCPDCIKDVNVNLQNALHLAVMNDKFEVLQVLTGWIQRMSQRNASSIESSVLNEHDFNYNSALHLAAIKNDQQAVRLLLDCRMVERNNVNGDGLTFLDILKKKRQNPVGGDFDLEQFVLTGCKTADSIPKSKERSDSLKSSFTFMTFCSTRVKRLRSAASDESRGVFLIVSALIITATYQTALQPPGGVHQSDNADGNAGSVVMKQTFFILLWLSNTLGFCCAVCYTYLLIPIGSLSRTWYKWTGSTLCLSYMLAMAIISPHPPFFFYATLTIFLLFALYLLMKAFISYWLKYLTVSSFKPRLTWFWKA